MNFVKRIILKQLNNMGYTLSKPSMDIKSQEFWDIYKLCKPFTMTSVEKMYALYSAVDYILSRNIQGHFVECGVWRGGSSMLVARMLQLRGITDRKIYLFDTFEGMSEPTQDDVDYKGNNASKLLKENEHNKEESVWCLASIEDVEKNIKLTEYSLENITFVKGKVEDTLPNYTNLGDIAILRLDTDWYESTKQELVYLYPQLVNNGVLIIDDYGFWEGCKKAVDEYLTENNLSILLNRVDFSARMAVKTADN